jgi:hypothetical protein
MLLSLVRKQNNEPQRCCCCCGESSSHSIYSDTASGTLLSTSLFGSSDGMRKKGGMFLSWGPPGENSPHTRKTTTEFRRTPPVQLTILVQSRHCPLVHSVEENEVMGSPCAPFLKTRMYRTYFVRFIKMKNTHTKKTTPKKKKDLHNTVPQIMACLYR